MEAKCVLGTRAGWIGLVLAAALVLAASGCHSTDRSPASGGAQGADSLDGLTASTVPITLRNTLCAKGLSTAEADAEFSQSTLSAWANRVRSETERHFYRFHRNPPEFENSEGFFKMLMLAVVLAEDFGVHYNPARKLRPGEASRNDDFFTDPD